MDQIVGQSNYTFSGWLITKVAGDQGKSPVQFLY